MTKVMTKSLKINQRTTQVNQEQFKGSRLNQEEFKTQEENKNARNTMRTTTGTQNESKKLGSRYLPVEDRRTMKNE